ncbi:MAG: DUF2062 domain-containing protein [Desulfobacterales bacterium]|nr:DUF2062 domain-containing protein [Desulfobacterales bacterium]
MQGLSVHKAALCLAVGITLGIFPVLGMTTLLCTAAAFALRLNLPAIQLVNYMAYPVQLALLMPFYSVGRWLFKSEGWLLPDENLIALLKNDFWGSMTRLWDLTLYAILTWTVICPILVILLYLLFKPVIKFLFDMRKAQQIQ